MLLQKRSRLLGKQLITRQYDTHTSQPKICVLLQRESTRMAAELAVQTRRCTGASSVVSLLTKCMQIIALTSED